MLSSFIQNPGGGGGLPLSGGTLTGALGITPATSGTCLTLTSGTVTTNLPAMVSSQTWNAAGVTFIGQDHTFTKTAAATGSLMARWTSTGRGSVAFDEAGEILIGNAAGSVGVRCGNGPAVAGVSGGALHVGCVNGNVYLGDIGTFGGQMAVNGPGSYCKGTSGFSFQWSSDSTSYGTADLFLYRRASAHLGLGVASATPIAQTFGGAEASGTDITGGTLNIGTRGTGTGTGGRINLQFHAAGSSGSTLGTLVDVLSVVGVGTIRITSIPTSSAGLSTGDVWSNGGVLTIV